MIKSLELHNFQSHKASHLELDPGMNVVIGPSDSGKTAIIRALRWLVWNRPSGDDIQSNWGGDTTVEINIEGDQLIFKGKSAKNNEYHLTANGKVQRFKAFGTSVPEEIQQALNLNEINLQQQLDSPFLLSNTPGEVAKHFNKVAHLDQIDSGLKNVQSWLREIERTISSKQEQLIEAEEDLTKFAHLDKFEIEVEILERLQTDLITKVNQTRGLKKLVWDSAEVCNLIEEQNKITKAGPLVDKILDWHKERDQNDQERDTLTELIEDIEEIKEEIKEESRILGAEKSVTSLLSLFEEQAEKQYTCDVLQKLVERVVYTTEGQKLAENSSKRLQTEFNAVFPDVCPLCGKLK